MHKILNMWCDYYIQTELVIEYTDKSGRINTLYTDRQTKKGYVNRYFHEVSDDEETCYKKYIDEIERKINQNTFNKILFYNNEWVKPSYKLKYEAYLMKTCREIYNIIKVYKKTSAWRRL